MLGLLRKLSKMCTDSWLHATRADDQSFSLLAGFQYHPIHTTTFQYSFTFTLGDGCSLLYFLPQLHRMEYKQFLVMIYSEGEVLFDKDITKELNSFWMPSWFCMNYKYYESFLMNSLSRCRHSKWIYFRYALWQNIT